MDRNRIINIRQQPADPACGFLFAVVGHTDRWQSSRTVGVFNCRERNPDNHFFFKFLSLHEVNLLNLRDKYTKYFFELKETRKYLQPLHYCQEIDGKSELK